MYFGLYDTGAAKNPWKNDKGLAGMASKFAIAQATAITAGYASYPFDTVRRRLQMQSEKPPSEWHYKGAADCLKKIIKEEGESDGWMRSDACRLWGVLFDLFANCCLGLWFTVFVFWQYTKMCLQNKNPRSK